MKALFMKKDRSLKAKLPRAIRILSGAIAVVCCVLVLEPPPSSAQAAASKIALQGGFGDIYTINPDGTNRTQLTSNTGFNHDPAFSRDGTRIAFTSDRDGRDEVYVMNSDGSNQTRLTSNMGSGSGAASFSGDGTRIAFEVDHDTYYSDIYVMNSDGSAQRAVTTTGLESRPAFSPDGTHIAFNSLRDGGAEIYRMNADGSGQTRLTPESFASKPAYSPDGTHIAYISIDSSYTTQILVMNADGSGRTQLTQGSHSFDHPAFSPDGTRIACVTDIDGSGIYVMNADGTNLRRVVDGQAPSWGGAETLPLVVNTTGDEPDADPNDGVCDVDLNKPGKQCTLRAAIQVANATLGKDKITFQIPSDDPGMVDGVAMIRPKTALPPITESISIDGSTQAPGTATPPVELDGSDIPRPAHTNGSPTKSLKSIFNYRLNWDGAVSGLVLETGASQCELRGLAVTRFPLFGIEVKGSSNTIEACHVGVDAKGLIAKANGWSGFSPEDDLSHDNGELSIKGAGVVIKGSSNQIGGTAPSLRNLFSGTNSAFGNRGDAAQPPGLVITGSGASGNIVEGNYFGPGVGGEQAPAPLPGDVGLPGYPMEDIAIVDAPNNRIGGFLPASTNGFLGQDDRTFPTGVQADHQYYGIGILIVGQSSTGNVISGNSIGYPLSLAVARSKGSGIVVVDAPGNVIGGSEEGAGNVIAAIGVSITLGGDLAVGNQVIRNVIGKVAGLLANGTGGFSGIVAGGSQNQLLRNTITNTVLAGIDLSGSQELIQGNDIDGNAGGAVDGVAGGDAIGLRIFEGTNNVVDSNTIHDHKGIGVDFVQASSTASVRLTANSIYHNRFGISLTGSGSPTPNDGLGDSDVGPNTLLNYPVIVHAIASPGGFTASGSYRSSGGRSYRLEFFANRVSPTGYGEGERYLGATDITTSFLGEGSFSFSSNAAVQPGEFITATATDPDGNTSEFSKSIVAHSGNDKDRDGVDDEIENRVPNGTSVTTKASATSLSQDNRATGQPAAGLGDGNGDGVMDSVQENVASFLGVKGHWLTLASPVGTSFVNVEPSGPPDFTQLPSGYSFPVGFMSFTLTGVPSGGSVSVTNILHDPFNVTTVFAYGPTPDNTQPHWYEFLFDGTTGARFVNGQIVLSFKDGARGDHDLANNGQITTILAPAIAPALLNISTRLKVTAGEDNLGIGGFIITGGSKDVLIRGIGPTLMNFSLQNVLADPTLALHTTDSTGADVVLATNDNWKVDDQTQHPQEQIIQLAGRPPDNDAESAIVITLPPGSYTALLRGKNGGTGIGLVEVYDLSPASGSILANISTRGFVDTGDNVMIGGFIVGASSTVVVRAMGPSMSATLSGFLADPNVSLYDANGMRIAFNEDWQQDAEASQIPDRLKPADTHESALHRTLAPGAYTAIVRGSGDPTGVGLVEVYYLQ
ncbi:MAG: DUF5050 domain-containing protein [Verrucomicrobiota bacterium]|nr:DUF5050 domain-containing protein [Verrucomicrobiota bacterium]